MRRLAGLILLLALAAPCGALADWQGSAGQAPRFSALTARSAEEWRALWAKIGQDAPAAPDFAKGEAAAALFLGMRTSGGYGIELDHGASADGARIVAWRERPPAGPATQALTAPFAVTVLPAGPAEPILFRNKDDGSVTVPAGEFERWGRRIDRLFDQIRGQQDHLRALEEKLRRIENAVGNPPIRPN